MEEGDTKAPFQLLGWQGMCAGLKQFSWPPTGGVPISTTWLSATRTELGHASLQLPECTPARALWSAARLTALHLQETHSLPWAVRLPALQSQSHFFSNCVLTLSVQMQSKVGQGERKGRKAL